MNRSIEELKIRAKKLQKQARLGDPAALAFLKLDQTSAQEIKRKACLNRLAVERGFQDWNHAKIILSGMATPETDMGKMWYSSQCTSLLNNWFANYAEAKDFLNKNPCMYLLPYKRQYMVVADDFIKVIGLFEGCDTLWKAINHDLVAHFGSDEWHQLVWHKLSS